MKGSTITGPVAKEAAELWSKVASNAGSVFWSKYLKLIKYFLTILIIRRFFINQLYLNRVSFSRLYLLTIGTCEGAFYFSG
jgi:hypothetical protein